MPAPPSLANACLFLDVDGTLLDLAAKPADVVVSRSLLDHLGTVGRQLNGALALVSGRSIADLDRLFAPLLLRATGVHGAEMRYSPTDAIWRDDRDALPADAWQALKQVVVAYPGVFAENKRYAFAVHYRNVPRSGAALKAALRTYLDGRPSLSMLAGHCVFEIKRPMHDKGTAINRFMERPPFAGRSPIFLGDDTTDEPGFAAVLAHGGQAYSVGREMAGVTSWVGRPALVRRWLAQLACQSLTAP